MSFPVKLHLPLITTRTEFKLNTLPPLPEITPRRDLGAHIRHYARRSSAPYTRPKQTRVRARSVGFDVRSDSSMSELSSSEASEIEEDNPSTSKIPKPNGEVGRTNSGGYNLQKALSWDALRYESFIKYINAEISKKLDNKRCYSKQKLSDVADIVNSASKKFNIVDTYSNDWPVRDALKLRLKYTSDSEKKRLQKVKEANLKKVLATSSLPE